MIIKKKYISPYIEAIRLEEQSELLQESITGKGSGQTGQGTWPGEDEEAKGTFGMSSWDDVDFEDPDDFGI